MKICADCANSFKLQGQTYRRCSKSTAKQGDDASLCAMMRRTDCGPDATLFEAKEA